MSHRFAKKSWKHSKASNKKNSTSANSKLIDSRKKCFPIPITQRSNVCLLKIQFCFVSFFYKRVIYEFWVKTVMLGTWKHYTANKIYNMMPSYCQMMLLLYKYWHHIWQILRPVWNDPCAKVRIGSPEARIGL